MLLLSCYSGVNIDSKAIPGEEGLGTREKLDP